MKDINNNFIVRIYRRDEKNPYGLLGIVEDVRDEGKHVFNGLDELMRILAGQSSGSGHEAAKRRSKTSSLRLKLPVTVKGTDSSGKRFTEKATLEDLSWRGMNISLVRRVKPGCSLRLSMGQGTGGEYLNVRIARVEQSKEGGLSMITVSLGGIL